MSALEQEIASQPLMWRTAAAMAAEAREALPAAGARIAVVGCGTSWFMAQSVAALREAGGLGETDAFTPTEMPPGRRYDAVVVISRSGTTTEIVRALRAGPVPSLVRRGPEAGDRRRRAGADRASALRPRRLRALRVPRPRLDHRPGQRGGAEAARGLPGLDRGLPGHGVPARPHQRGRAAQRRLVARRGRAGAARTGCPDRRHRGGRRARPDGGARARPSGRRPAGRGQRPRPGPAEAPHQIRSAAVMMTSTTGGRQ